MSIISNKNYQQKEIEQIRTNNGGIVDYVYMKIGNNYQRIFVGTREIEYNYSYLQYKNIDDKMGVLKNYRIYGNTGSINGINVGVGNQRNNLIDINADIIGLAYGGTTGNNPVVNLADVSQYKGFWIPCESGTSYTLSRNAATNNRFSLGFTATKTSGASLLSFTTPLDTDALSITVTAPEGANYVCAYLTNQGDTIDAETDLFLEENFDTNGKYEPKKYYIPIKVDAQNNSVTTNIFLSKPLQRGDYIDYITQKRYNLDGTTDTIELPQIYVAIGTNVLSINTEVPSSKIYIKGKIKSV